MSWFCSYRQMLWFLKTVTVYEKKNTTQKSHSVSGSLCLLSPENTDLALASRTPPVETQNPEMTLGLTKTQHICRLRNVLKTSIFFQNLDFLAFMAKTGHVWQKWVVWSGWKSSCSCGDQGFHSLRCQIFITFNIHVDDVALEVQPLYM